MPPSSHLASPLTAQQPADAAFSIYCHLDIVGRHRDGKAISCITGWIVAEKGYEVVGLGLQRDETTVLRCNYPFHRGDMVASIKLAGSDALTGFNLILPERMAFVPDRLALVAMIAPDDGEVQPWRFQLPIATGTTHQVRLEPEQRLPFPTVFTEIAEEEAGPILEGRLFDQLARERRLTLRLDLINKCNLRCVMCHYSNEEFAKRPAQRISPEQFAAWFAPLAPVTRDVVLSCGDEPLMSPHFETILRELAGRDPEVRVRFCTNAMLLTEKIAAAIVEARVYLVMLSFDGVASETLHRIRVGSDYRRIVKNIIGLKRARARGGYGGPRFVFNFVMLESNIHEASVFVHMAKRLGGDYIDFRHAVPFDLYDIEHEMLENYKPKYNYYRERIIAAAAECGIDVYIPPAFGTPGHYDASGDPICGLDEFNEVLASLGENYSQDPEAPRPAEPVDPSHITESAHFFCDRPFSEVMIRDQRDVYPCTWHREKMGTLDGKTTLEEIFFGDNFRRVRLAMLDPQGAPGCAGCPIKMNRLPTRMQ